MAKQHAQKTEQKLEQMQTYNQEQTHCPATVYATDGTKSQNQVLQLQNNLTTVQASFRELLQYQPGYNRAWTLAEVEYLVQSANVQLQFNNSVANAMTLFKLPMTD